VYRWFLSSFSTLFIFWCIIWQTSGVIYIVIGLFMVHSVTGCTKWYKSCHWGGTPAPLYQKSTYIRTSNVFKSVHMRQLLCHFFWQCFSFFNIKVLMRHRSKQFMWTFTQHYSTHTRLQLYGKQHRVYDIFSRERKILKADEYTSLT